MLVHTTSPEVTETALELLKAIVAEDEGLSLKMVSGTAICDTLVNHIVGRWQRGREFEEHRSFGCDYQVIIPTIEHGLCSAPFLALCFAVVWTVVARSETETDTRTTEPFNMQIFSLYNCQSYLYLSIRSDACDVLVLMLSHDSSMKHVYSAQNGALLQG